MGGKVTLALDIGGSGIKAALLDEEGGILGEKERVPTPPAPIAPEELIAAIDRAAAPLGAFDRVSVGFPGFVKEGRVLTAPNLGSSLLAGFDLEGALGKHWGKPVRVANDADIQGLGAIRGEGVEMVLTLGTGAGTALFKNGALLPHLELAHHPVRGNKTYDEYIGSAARDKKGNKAWNKRVARVIEILRSLVHFDHLYIGGGNAQHLSLMLPQDVSVVPNVDGLIGGAGLWRQAPRASLPQGESGEGADGGRVSPGGEAI